VVPFRCRGGCVADSPGVDVASLHPAWLQAACDAMVKYVAPSGRLLALAALIALCLTGAWNPRTPVGEAVSQPLPATPQRVGGLDGIRVHQAATVGEKEHVRPSAAASSDVTGRPPAQ